jgi:hypothetical protein
MLKSLSRVFSALANAAGFLFTIMPSPFEENSLKKVSQLQQMVTHAPNHQTLLLNLS